jgi:hypothetical protein
VNLKLKQTERVSRTRADNLPSQGCTRANHSELDNGRRKIVQIDLLKLRAEHGGRRLTGERQLYGTQSRQR